MPNFEIFNPLNIIQPFVFQTPPNGNLTFGVTIEPNLSFTITINEEVDSMSNATLYVGSDNDIVVADLTLESNDSLVSGATVTYTLRDSDLASVATGSCSEVSTGQYRGTIESSVSLDDGSRYYLDVSAVNGDASVTARKPLVAAYYQGA